MPRASRVLCAVAISALVGAVVSGCVRVRAHERATLAKPAMQAPVWPERSASDEHVYTVREGTAGATSAGGGGCGCN